MDKEQTDNSQYCEKLEQVFAAYEKTFDLEVALDLTPLTNEERAKLETDELLAARILIFDAKVKQNLVGKLKNLIDHAESESVQLAALKEFGRTFYPKRFEDKLKGDLNLNHGGSITIVDDV